MIHNGWAFNENEKEMSQENLTAYEWLMTKNKFKMLKYITEYGCFKEVIEATEPFTGAEMMLWADRGNLCFGGIFNGGDDIYKTMQPGKYTVKIYTD